MYKLQVILAHMFKNEYSTAKLFYAIIKCQHRKKRARCKSNPWNIQNVCSFVWTSLKLFIPQHYFQFFSFSFTLLRLIIYTKYNVDKWCARCCWISREEEKKKLMETMVSFRLTAIVSRKWSSLSLLLSTPPMLNSVGLLSFCVDGFCMMANLMCRKMMRCSKIFAIAMLSTFICRCCLFL